jgi:hypothetical protein
MTLWVSKSKLIVWKTKSREQEQEVRESLQMQKNDLRTNEMHYKMIMTRRQMICVIETTVV